MAQPCVYVINGTHDQVQELQQGSTGPRILFFLLNVQTSIITRAAQQVSVIGITCRLQSASHVQRPAAGQSHAIRKHLNCVNAELPALADAGDPLVAVAVCHQDEQQAI